MQLNIPTHTLNATIFLSIIRDSFLRDMEVSIVIFIYIECYVFACVNIFDILQRLIILQTLVAGLDFISFDLPKVRCFIIIII